MISSRYIYGVTLPDANDNYDLLQWLVMCLLLASHAMNWCGDRVAYRGWNTSEKVTWSSSPMGPDAGLVTKLGNVLRIVEQNSGGQENRTIINRLDEIRNEVVRLSTFAGWYVWSWFVVPFACSFVALLWHS